MAKKRKQSQVNQAIELDVTAKTNEFGRGTIRDNALKAVVTSKLFKTRVVKAKKGKGSFQRNEKYSGRESYSMAA
ncbi:alternative ribosome-rescue factor A [Photobacterium lipolyticum]|uniref:Ribosome alternative rescue factor ArfA n=1 Tax=Photobacterium lipolyticum TaxID=266810 RepID=A0A2T3N2G0_9GAMM|nr:ribosome alternative rescue factor ArfA [Photobacterium lipolyticum]PSW06528.1 ribosome alternative rescue factor ArfA [Photobacterium lipolyticum]